MPSKTFVKKNDEFECEYCGVKVIEHPTSSRDHCIECLWSKHVDLSPGDRRNPCKGLLKPIGIRIKNQKEQIVYKCTKCNSLTYCIIAPDDNKDKIIELVSLEFRD